MRTILPLAALALLAACGDPAPVAEATSEAPVTTPAPLPTVAANARTTLTYAGTYSQLGADGNVTTLKLNSDDSYEWSGADGRVAKGTYSWYKDGSRVLLDEAGQGAVYAIADGAVYRLADKDAPLDTLTAETMWRRGAM